MSDTAGNLPAHIDDLSRVLTCRIYSDISDSLTRKGEGFAEGIAGDGVVIVGGNKWCINPCKHDLAVRLIGNDVDLVSVFL